MELACFDLTVHVGKIDKFVVNSTVALYCCALVQPAVYTRVNRCENASDERWVLYGL